MAWSDIADAALTATRDVFGEAVTYTPSGGSGESITAIFEEAYEEVVLQGDVAVSATGPMCSVRIADLSQSPVAGDTITRSSVVYTVEDVRVDGGGGADLALSR